MSDGFGRFVLYSLDTNQGVALRWREPAQVTQERAGGWRSIPRPQLRPLSTWDGHQPIQLQLKGDLNAWEAQSSVMPQIARLRELAEKVGGQVRRPHRLRLLSRNAPNPTLGNPEWFIAALEIVEELHLPGGACARALCTVTLEQYVSADIDIRVERQKKTTVRTYKWRKGDTLSAVARRELRDAKRARDIRRLNPKIKRWSTVETGDAIKLPAR